MSFGEKLKSARKKAGLTQTELSKISGISRSSIAQYEGNTYEPDIEKIKTLAQALGVSEQDLFDPSKKEEIARQEIKSHPFKYIDEIEEAAMLKHAVVADVMSIKAAAGTGNNIESVDVFFTGRKAVIDTIIFKTPPKGPVRLMQVDGYSMVPMLYPDSWVLYEDAFEYTTDGLYVINYNNELMVKLLQFDPAEGVLDVISVNKKYKSYRIDPSSQSIFHIVGKVLRCVI